MLEIRKVIVLTIAMLLLSGTAFADGCIGLYADEDHVSCAATGTGFYPVEMWIWCLPDPFDGMICAEFMIVYPANVITSTVTKNEPIISVDMGDYASGYSVCFINCHYDWTWPGHQLLYVTDPTETTCEVVKHPDPNIECIYMSDCGLGLCPYCVCSCPRLWLNSTDDPCADPCPTEETSWGAIKSLYE